MDPVTIVVSLIVSTTLAAASRALTNLTTGQRKVAEPKSLNPTKETPYESPLANITDPGGPQIGIFGRGRVGGRVVLSEKSGNATYNVNVIAGAPVTVNAIYINNALIARDGSDNVTTSPWKSGASASSMNIKVYSGAQTAADSVLKAAFAGWTSDFIGYQQTYLRIKTDPSVAVAYTAVYQAGQPDITSDVSGFPCYDPRDGAQDVANRATWKITKNSALIGAGYLVHQLGRNLPVTAINWTSVAAAADVCDQQIALASGLTESRYECFLVWKTSERHEDVIGRIESSMAGRVYRVGGQYVVEAGTFDVSNAVDIVPDDYAGDGIAFADTNPIAQICNGVRGRFASPSNNYELRDYPAYQDAAALAEDGGLDYWLDIDFPAVTSPSQAQRLARIAYKRARLGSGASVDLKFKHFNVVRGDMVRITDDLAGLASIYYRVEKDKLAGQDYQVTLEITREESGMFSWSVTDEQSMPPTVNLTAAGGAGVNPDDTGALQPPGATFHVQSGSTKSSWVIIATFFASPTSRATDYGFNVGFVASATIARVNPTSGRHYVTVATASDSLTTNFNASPYNTSPDLWTSTYATLRFQCGVDAKVSSTGEVSAANFANAITVNPSQTLVSPYLSASTTPLYCLPPPPAPQISSIGSGSALLNFYLAGGGSRATNIELWENTTNNFGTATKINDVTNANGTKTVTGTIGSTKYYWTRSHNSADSKTSPASNVLLVGF